MLKAFIFGFIWVIGSIIVWWGLLFVIGNLLAQRVNEQRLWVEWFDFFFNDVVILGGTLLIPSIIAMLVMRSKLPGTTIANKGDEGDKPEHFDNFDQDV